MISPDIVNGAFEFIGAYFTWKNFFVLKQDKILKGVYWPTTAFFASWSLWNCFYYPSLGQWFSFYGGIALGSGNIAWIILAIYYLYFKKEAECL